MSQNYIPIYDDTVVKMSIKQGLEKERTEGKHLLTKDNNSPKNLPGHFTMGELAFTRDTYRVFCGNVSDDPYAKTQNTLGGSIVGNKYLGLINSAPDRPKANSTETNGDSVTIDNNNASVFEVKNIDVSKGFKPFKYENNGSSDPNKYWDVTSSYNDYYGAYNGDFIYDLYRNGLIIFDNTIKNIGAYATNDPNVQAFTEDMFGEGYVILYNLIPDGDTLTLEDRRYSHDGNADINRFRTADK